MRKIHVLGAALFAVFAFCAVLASSAFALEDQWLWEGSVIKAGEELSVESESSNFLLIHLASLFSVEVVVKCDGIFDGVVLPKGEDLITELLSLNNGRVELAAGKELVCEAEKGCEKVSPSDVFVVAEDLPWLTQLTLDPNGDFLDLFSEETTAKPGKPAYEVDCLIGTILVESLCEGETSALITLSGTELLGIFNAANLEAEGLEGNCGTTTKVALQEGEGPILHTNGGVLDVSEA